MPYQSLAATTFCGPDGTGGAVLAGALHHARYSCRGPRRELASLTSPALARQSAQNARTADAHILGLVGADA